jgi:hypothetical protein
VEPVGGCLSVGSYLGHRLLSVGCDTVFCVPGDFNRKFDPKCASRVVSSSSMRRACCATRKSSHISSDSSLLTCPLFVACMHHLTSVPVLDALAQVPGLRVVNCNSELAAAYAAGRQLQQLTAGRSYLLLMRCIPTQLQFVLM